LERPISHLVGLSLAAQQPASQQQSQDRDRHRAQGHEGHLMHRDDGMYPVDDPVKKQVPGYPQDMWMDTSQWVPNKPEFYGLRPTWDRAMMGMMTLVRVLPPELYDQIMELRKQAMQQEKPVEQRHQHKP
jgi:hypothetical protein